MMTEGNAAGALVKVLVDQIPPCTQRVLCLSMADLSGALQGRGVEIVPAAPPDGPLPYEDDAFDCILMEIGAAAEEGGQGVRDLGDAARMLTRNGRLFAWTSQAGPAGEAALRSAAQQMHLAVYGAWDTQEAASSAPGPAFVLFVLVRSDYDPLAHGRELIRAGRCDWAHEILSAIPQILLQDPRAAVLVDADMQYCLGEMDRREGERGRIERFFEDQCLFYDATQHEPMMVSSYQSHAAFWRRLGDAGMAVRLLRSIEHVRPDAATREMLAELGPLPGEPALSLPDPPVWPQKGPGPRILLVGYEWVDYGLDTLYHGLCECLGDDRVVEFPWKPTLHGAPPESHGNYPCCFNHTGKNLELDALEGQLAQRAFDVVLFGDMRRQLDLGAARRLVKAAAGTPVFLVDQEDSPVDCRRQLLGYLGIERVRGYFKREMLACVDYGPRSFPLPFSYPEERVPAGLGSLREQELFWAGHRRFGLRRLYLECLEGRLGRSFVRTYEPEEYSRVLASSRVALSFFGFGFDTVRYWEAPAHGCTLLAERLPIRVPHNFRDGETAVFFDDLPDLEEKVDFCLAHPAEAERIARAGHEWFRRYHTTKARAGQLLAWAEESLTR